MLVHDVKADKAAASLDVAVGTLSDPAMQELQWNNGCTSEQAQITKDTAR